MITEEELKALQQNPDFMKAYTRWWEEDFSWEGLAKKFDKPGGRTKQEVWQQQQGFLQEFAGRKWTRLHLPAGHEFFRRSIRA